MLFYGVNCSGCGGPTHTLMGMMQNPMSYICKAGNASLQQKSTSSRIARDCS